MGDYIQQNTMNFDLNLEPVDHPLQIGTTSDVVSNHSTPRFSSLSRHVPVSAMRLVGDDRFDNEHERPLKRKKTSDNYVDKNDNVSFFDCNICLDLANDPVVTCCGHLFCWACLYRWLFVHSKANECPNCKGEVTKDTITPIYSRGNRTLKENKNPSVEVPSRPEANRIENWREAFQRDKLNAPMFDMIRRLDNRFDITRDPVPENPQDGPVTPLLDRIFTSRGIRRVRESHDRVTGYVTSADTVADLPNRMDIMPNLLSAESFVESYFRDHPDEQNEEEFALSDRHSMLSVVGVMHTESPSGETNQTG